jgi:aerobic-type carbon monoxide dehydrogenase small subunit (CoxS/CutS family)
MRDVVNRSLTALLHPSLANIERRLLVVIEVRNERELLRNSADANSSSVACIPISNLLKRWTSELPLRSKGISSTEECLPRFRNAFPDLESGMASIRLAVNRRTYTVDADAQTSLLSVLRDHLDLTGSKYGCGEGACGACTVLVDGRAQRSCITKVGAVAQKQITTIEGIARGDQLHPVQEAFLEAGAMQCAYCTSGMIISAVALLSENPHPTENQIVDFMDGNICRCGTYARIITAIGKAAKVMSQPEAARGVGR